MGRVRHRAGHGAARGRQATGPGGPTHVRREVHVEQRLLGVRLRRRGSGGRFPADHDLRLLGLPPGADLAAVVHPAHAGLRRDRIPRRADPHGTPGLWPALDGPTSRRDAVHHGDLPNHGGARYHEFHDRHRDDLPDRRGRSRSPTLRYDDPSGEMVATFAKEYAGIDKDGKATSCVVDHEAWWVDSRGVAATDAAGHRVRRGRSGRLAPRWGGPGLVDRHADVRRGDPVRSPRAGRDAGCHDTGRGAAVHTDAQAGQEGQGPGAGHPGQEVGDRSPADARQGQVEDDGHEADQRQGTGDVHLPVAQGEGLTDLPDDDQEEGRAAGRPVRAVHAHHCAEPSGPTHAAPRPRHQARLAAGRSNHCRWPNSSGSCASGPCTRATAAARSSRAATRCSTRADSSARSSCRGLMSSPDGS